MKVSIISAGVHRGSGGPTKTIAAFKDSLEAEVFSFCDPKQLAVDPLAIPGAVAVPSSSIPSARQFGWPTRQARSAVVAAASQSQLLSCHLFYRYHSLWVKEINKKHGVPYWFVPHGILDPWVMSYGTLQKKLYWRFGGKEFLDRASTVIFSTTAERDKAASQFELPSSEVIPWPVELVDVSSRQVHRQSIRRQLGIPPAARALIFFGRLHSMKRPLETIRAIAAVDDPNLHLIVVGNDQDVCLQDCRQAAEEERIADRVHLVGPVYGDAKYHYLFAADAYVSLSWRENFNHTAAESLSAGLPAILSPGNDLQSDIAHADCSWGIKDNEPASAAAAISDFCNTSSSELEAMGRRGREWVQANLDFDLFSKRLNAVAERIVRG